MGMSTAELVPSVEPKPRLWTREEFHQMADLGWFEGQRAELVGGEVMVLSPQKSLHFKTADKGRELLERAYGPGFWIRLQGPLILGPDSEPEPDISVVQGKREDYFDHPTSALLVVEVSDTTLTSDRGRKASLFARAGLAHYWIINLIDEHLEAYSQPVSDPSQPHGFAYGNYQVFRRGQELALPGKPIQRIQVTDLLP